MALKLLLPIHEVKLLLDHCRQKVEKCKGKKGKAQKVQVRRLASNVLNITNANVHSFRCVFCVELKTKPNKAAQKVEPSKLNYDGVMCLLYYFLKSREITVAPNFIHYRLMTATQGPRRGWGWGGL